MSVVPTGVPKKMIDSIVVSSTSDWLLIKKN
jgi:hypothetical protein